MTKPEARSEDTATTGSEPQPFLRVVRGDATPEEVAAVVAVLASLRAPDTPAPRRRPEWAAPHRAVRRPLAHGAGGWRASALPR